MFEFPTSDLELGDVPVARVEWGAAVEALAMLVVQAGTLLLVDVDGAPSATSGGGSMAAASSASFDLWTIPLVLAVVAIEFLVLGGLWKLYQRLPERWQKRVLWGLVVALVIGIWGPLIGLSYWYAVAAVAVYVATRLLSRFDLYWVVHNGMAVAIGVFGGLVGASAFPVWVLVCGLLAAAVLDYLAVIETSVMSGAIRASAEFSIPNYIVVPARARVDMDRLRDRLRGEGIVDGPEDVAGVLGLGDLALPSMLVGAVAVEAGDPTALPVVLGVVGAAGSLFVLASFLETSREGGLPALPIIVPGTLAGVGIGLALPTALALVGV